MSIIPAIGEVKIGGLKYEARLGKKKKKFSETLSHSTSWL
jgi:hypothetical protein